MKKKLLIFGKLLIIVGFLNPIPIGFLQYSFQPLSKWVYSAKIIWDGSEYAGPYDYWWPGLILIMAGFILCWLANNNGQIIDDKRIFWQEEIMPLVKVFGVCILAPLALIAAVLLLVLLVVGIYYAFFSRYMPTILPICGGVGVIVYLLYIGWKVFKSDK